MQNLNVAFDKYYSCNTCIEIKVDICKHIYGCMVLCLNDRPINIILTIANLQPRLSMVMSEGFTSGRNAIGILV